MTTMTLETTTTAAGHPTLEALVDRLLAVILGDMGRTAPRVPQAIHAARRLRQSGDLGGALAAFHGVDTADATDSQLRWLYAEWLDIARRRFAGESVLLYSPATGRAAVLLPRGDGDDVLEVAVALGMGWPVGKLVSKRSLRGLKTLDNKNCENKKQGGQAW